MSPNTHPIGPGTANLSVNVPAADHAVIGRESYVYGFRSMGEYVRTLIRLGRQFATACRLAIYSAEADAEAMRLIHAAKQPNSPGGSAIIECEQPPIERAILRSQRLDQWQARKLTAA